MLYFLREFVKYTPVPVFNFIYILIEQEIFMIKTAFFPSDDCPAAVTGRVIAPILGFFVLENFYSCIWPKQILQSVTIKLYIQKNLKIGKFIRMYSDFSYYFRQAF